MIRDFSGGERIDLAKGVSWDTLRSTCGGYICVGGHWWILAEFGEAIPVMGAISGPLRWRRTWTKMLASACKDMQ